MKTPSQPHKILNLHAVWGADDANEDAKGEQKQMDESDGKLYDRNGNEVPECSLADAYGKCFVTDTVFRTQNGTLWRTYQGRHGQAFERLTDQAQKGATR